MRTRAPHASCTDLRVADDPGQRGGGHVEEVQEGLVPLAGIHVHELRTRRIAHCAHEQSRITAGYNFAQAHAHSWHAANEAFSIACVSVACAHIQSCTHICIDV